MAYSTVMRNSPTKQPGFFESSARLNSAISADRETATLKCGRKSKLFKQITAGVDSRETTIKKESKMAKQKKIRSDAKSLKMSHPEHAFKGYVSNPMLTLDSIPWDENGHRGVDIQIGVENKLYPHITIGQHKDGDIWVSVTSFIQDDENPGKMKHRSSTLSTGTTCHTNAMCLSGSSPFNGEEVPRLSVEVQNFVNSENNKGVA